MALSIEPEHTVFTKNPRLQTPTAIEAAVGVAQIYGLLALALTGLAAGSLGNGLSP